MPASLSRTLTEVHQEGIRIPPAKLYRRGELNEELLRILLTNVRMPEQNWGDLKALAAAMNTGERKVHEIVRRFGVETFREGAEDLLDYAERQARHVIRRIPDGGYFFADYMDEDNRGRLPGPHRTEPRHRRRRDHLRLLGQRPAARLLDQHPHRRRRTPRADDGGPRLRAVHPRSYYPAQCRGLRARAAASSPRARSSTRSSRLRWACAASARCGSCRPSSAPSPRPCPTGSRPDRAEAGRCSTCALPTTAPDEG